MTGSATTTIPSGWFGFLTPWAAHHWGGHWGYERDWTAPVNPTATPSRGSRFRPPAEQHGHLSRSRLVALLEERVREQQTVVVVAPSGYGKTSAAAEWAGTHPDRVAWLSLGPLDSDAKHVTSGIIHALQSLASSTADTHLDALNSIDPTDVDPAVAYEVITEALVEAPTPVYPRHRQCPPRAGCATGRTPRRAHRCGV